MILCRVMFFSFRTRIRMLFPIAFLPPAYVVRREGNTFTLLDCPRGGVPVSHNALQHFPECHGAAGVGVPCQVQPGGRGYPARSSRGGYPGRGGTLAGGVPWQGVPWLGGTLAGGGYPGRGGTQLGQHREYLLHGGRYASCVHAGGLSCFLNDFYYRPHT